MEETIRILSYNVRSLRDDREALARVFKACAPDIACVQEAPRFFGWRRAARGLAKSVGMQIVAGGANASGNLLLASERVSVEHAEALYLTHSRGLHLRGMAIAVVGVGTSRFMVASTHLSLDEKQRRDQAYEVLGHLQAAADSSQTVSKVLCGDFNSHPGSEEWSTLTEHLADAWVVSPGGEEYTSTATCPYQRLDAVFVSRDVDVVRAGVPTDLISPACMAVASDHRPVLAVIRIRTSSSSGE